MKLYILGVWQNAHEILLGNLLIAQQEHSSLYFLL